MSKEKIEILWFKRDLRTEDNPILSKPILRVLPIFIFDENILEALPKNDKRVNFIFENVLNLKEKLKEKNLDLAIFYGKPKDVFDFLSEKFEIVKIYSSSDNDIYSKKRDETIKSKYNLETIFDNFLIEPEKILSREGKPIKVFSFFLKKAENLIYSNPIKKYNNLENLKRVDFDYNSLIHIKNKIIESRNIQIESLNFEKEKIKFQGANLNPSSLLKRFEKIIDNYELERNFPYKNSTSLLSVHLRFGTISIREVLSWALNQKNYKAFLREILWREFFNYLFHHFPKIEETGLRKSYINWRNDEKLFKKWKKGETGIPLVDAGMRQLEEEGFIHNRVRMVVSDFLVKKLKVNWQLGEKYFALKLLDYESSSNFGNWQWVSGIGADPKSLYRSFNPFIQSKKYDKDGFYIKKYLPELKSIPISKLHNPKYFQENKIKNYPKLENPLWKNQLL